MARIMKMLLISMMINAYKLVIPPNEVKEELSINFYLISVTQLPIVRVDIGEPKQLFNLILDINAEQTWIANLTFQSSASVTFNKLGYYESSENDQIKGYRSIDSFIVDTIPIKSFDFLLAEVNNTASAIKGALSLRREFERKKYSFVSRALRSPSPNLKFTLIFNNIHQGTILIDSANTIHADNKNEMYNCSLEANHFRDKWACNITHVFMGDYGLSEKVDLISKEPYYEINSYNSNTTTIGKVAIFETVYNKIYVDKEFMSYLKRIYFSRSKCISDETNESITMQCPKADIVRTSQLNFVFDSRLNVYLSYRELFDCNQPKQACLFNIEYNSNINKDNSTWLIGLTMLRAVTTTFDSSGAIYFSGNRIENVRVNTQTELKHSISYISLLLVFFGGVIIAMITGIGIIYAFRFKNKKKHQISTEKINKLLSVN